MQHCHDRKSAQSFAIKVQKLFQIKNQTGTVLSILTYFVNKLWL